MLPGVPTILSPTPFPAPLSSNPIPSPPYRTNLYSCTAHNFLPFHHFRAPYNFRTTSVQRHFRSIPCPLYPLRPVYKKQGGVPPLYDQSFHFGIFLCSIGYLGGQQSSAGTL